MKLNEDLVIVGEKVLLIPYKKHHVEKYHEWMKSPELLEKTASEPLPLDEEYEMQQKWWLDNDKCTFIVLSRSLYETNKNEIEAMCGDVNIFFNNVDGDVEGELELMIAESSMRGMGLGKECARLMMYYGTKYLKVRKYFVKIGDSNKESFHLFQKLGFQLESYSKVFKESTYELLCDSQTFMKDVYKEVEGYFTTRKYEL